MTEPADAGLLRAIADSFGTALYDKATAKHKATWAECSRRLHALADELEYVYAMEGALEDAADLLDEYVADDGHKMALAETLRVYGRKLASLQPTA